MVKKVLLVFLIVVVAFLAYVSSRPGDFHYERSGVINAAPEKIYPYLSHFKLGSAWSPYEKMDPNMKREFTGTEGEVGSTMAFDGNREVGAGKLEILSLVPNQAVDIRLTMIKPFAGENLIQYRLTPEAAGGTRFTWTMSGDGGFVGKLMTVLIDCEKMMGDQFEKGIANLKAVVESAP